ncbi:MAG: flavodoxin family protein [Woeseiaceae bacterium]
MSQATKVLSINGSYRDNGITDQAIKTAAQSLAESGAVVESIMLREYPIEFCLNCRACTQEPGVTPGHCVHDDSMRELVEKIEEADAYIIAAPTNLGSVTAIFKRFMERLVVYAYWPWGAPGPRYRKAKLPKKKAMLISSCAAPGLMGRWLYGTQKQLRMTAQMIGAAPVGTVFAGMIAGEADAAYPERMRRKAEVLAKKLL